MGDRCEGFPNAVLSWSCIITTLPKNKCLSEASYAFPPHLSKGNILVKEDDCSGPPASTWSSAAVALLSSLLRLPALAPPPPRLVLLDAGMIAEVGGEDGGQGSMCVVAAGGPAPPSRLLPPLSIYERANLPPSLSSPPLPVRERARLPPLPRPQLRPTDQRNLVDFFRALTRQEGENLGRSILTLSEQHTCKVKGGERRSAEWMSLLAAMGLKELSNFDPAVCSIGTKHHCAIFTLLPFFFPVPSPLNLAAPCPPVLP